MARCSYCKEVDAPSWWVRGTCPKCKDFSWIPGEGLTYKKLLKIKKVFLDNEAAKGVKFDNLKPRWSLLPRGVIKEVVAVLEHGAKKYSTDNWMKVIDGEERYYNAAMRHIEARREGEINDPESRRPHLAHALCCIMFWFWFDMKKRRGHR